MDKVVLLVCAFAGITYVLVSPDSMVAASLCAFILSSVSVIISFIIRSREKIFDRIDSIEIYNDFGEEPDPDEHWTH